MNNATSKWRAVLSVLGMAGFAIYLLLMGAIAYLEWKGFL